jgi:ABC-type bacteriocin/lantibiotic exporter with double-glycine peptidase domain
MAVAHWTILWAIKEVRVADGIHRRYAAGWRRYIGFYPGFPKLLLLSTLAPLVQAFLLAVVAYFVRYGFDTAIPSGDSIRLALAGGAVAFLVAASSAVTLWLRHATAQLTRTADLRLREALLAKCFTLSRAYYDHADLAQFQATLIQDSEQVERMSQALVVQLLPALCMSLPLGGLLLYLNPRLFLAVLMVAPLCIAVAQAFRRGLLIRYCTFRRAFQAFSKGVLFLLQTLELTQIQAAESFERKRQRQNLAGLLQAGLALTKAQLAYREIQTVVMILIMVMILILGGSAVTQKTMTLGQLLAFYVVLGLLSGQLKLIWAAIPPLVNGAESLRALLDLEDSQPYQGQRRLLFSGQIRLSGVSFAYGEQLIVQHVDLVIAPPCRVAIVGANGAGKSTLLGLILGFHRPQQGALFANGVPYEELDMADLRRQIGTVMQHPRVFAGTLWENITYGYPEASQAEVEAACELALATEFISQLPQGLATQVGESGALLSGGQRQRLAIARAVLRKPSLLILDEPTNHLDQATVQRLLKNLQRLQPAPAILLVSHDPDIVRHAHAVYALREGRLVSAAEQKEHVLRRSG